MNKNLKIKGLMLAGVIIIISFIYAVNIQPIVFGWYSDGQVYSDLKTFESYDELIDFLKTNIYHGHYEHGEQVSPGIRVTIASNGMTKAFEFSDGYGGSTVDYSKTNIQVEGVDEPDIVKTDGTYIYLVANSKIYIIKAYPAEEATVLSTIPFNENIDVSNIFIKDDKLVIFGTSSRYPITKEDAKEDYPYYWGGISTTTIEIYDVSNRKNPELLKDIELDGRYFDARMINNYVYVITVEYPGDIFYVLEENGILNVPQITIDSETRKILPDDIYYVNNSRDVDTMTHIISIDLTNGEVNQKSFLLGYSQKMYVSKNNIYITSTNYDYIDFQPLVGIPYRRSIETTVIHKISIQNGKIEYTARGEVPGRVLNQFSMDEHNGFFRIATTVGKVWDHEHKSSNNIYILDESLNRVSEIENIAPGERIYSARFMGNKAYLVTFKKVDPFFTIDLSDPYNPKVLGELKIPGYSNYLHPFDENHVIGIGKDTVEALDELKEIRGIDFAWYQGIKIALFDVSDFENPKEIAKIVIGDRGTNSPALYDHKAFLFNREKELLVIPVSLYEIDEEIKEQNNGYTGSIYGKFTFQGAYVYKLNLNGFEFKGRITHRNQSESIDNQYYWCWGSSNYDIIRTLFIDNTLYTISNNMVKMNSLDDLSEINSIQLN